jgi:hypothetical protein
MPSRPIEATSQTDWSDLPMGWRDAAIRAVVDSGRGDTPMATIAVIACGLWDVHERIMREG